MNKYEAELLSKLIDADRKYWMAVARNAGYVSPSLRVVDAIGTKNKEEARLYRKAFRRLIASGLADVYPDENGNYRLALA